MGTKSTSSSGLVARLVRVAVGSISGLHSARDTRELDTRASWNWAASLGGPTRARGRYVRAVLVARRSGRHYWPVSAESPVPGRGLLKDPVSVL